jgi:hypothetical protein
MPSYRLEKDVHDLFPQEAAFPDNMLHALTGLVHPWTSSQVKLRLLFFNMDDVYTEIALIHGWM